MDYGMSGKSTEDNQRIYDALNSVWGGRILGGLLILIPGWAIVSKIIEATQ